MKKIEAIIRPEKLEDVRESLERLGYPGLSVTEIEGHGRQKGTFQRWHGEDFKVEFLPKLKVEIICLDERLTEILEVLRASAFTGAVGDGKIFVYDVAEAVRIRTGERGAEAIL